MRTRPFVHAFAIVFCLLLTYQAHAQISARHLNADNRLRLVFAKPRRGGVNHAGVEGSGAQPQKQEGDEGNREGQRQQQ